MNSKPVNPVVYRLLWILVRVGLFFWHPFSRFRGREHIPEGGCLIVANHSSLADPVWLLLALGPGRRTHIIAKKEVMGVPVLGRVLRWVGVFGVDRGGADIAAVKQSLEILKNNEKLLIFPEGTRVKPGKTVEPKTGAALMAQRAGVPVLPVYITRRKRPFCPIEVCFGAPYTVTAAARRITAAELDEATQHMMATIYGLETAR